MTPRFIEIADFMAERHNIYLKRAAGLPGPWTDDPVLSTGRFCNIFRELDTVTIWIEENIRKPYADHKYLWFMLCIARYINWPPTLEALIEAAEKNNVPCWPSHPDFDLGEAFIATEPAGFSGSSLTWALHQCAKRQGKVYTGAYMIRAESDPSKPWYSWSKHKYIAEIVLGRLWEDRYDWGHYFKMADPYDLTLNNTWKLFQHRRYIGWGPFMAYEVVTDLRHTRYLEHAADIYTWANAGPGAIRGLNLLYGRDWGAKPKAAQTNDEMFRLMEELNTHNYPEFCRVFGEWKNKPWRFEMRDIEHSLCEYAKWKRGYTRAKYDWTKAKPLNETTF